MKHRLPDGKAEPGSHLGSQIAADDAQHRAGQGAAQHFQAGMQDVRQGAPRRFNQNGQAAHVVGQRQIEINLPQDEHCAHGGHGPLLPP